MIILKIDKINMFFNSGKNTVEALSLIDFNIAKSEFLLIKGASGSGKSTLLFILGGMLKPTAGKIFYKEKDLYALNSKERDNYRSKDVGFVFQSYYLLPYLNIFDNIMVLNNLNGVKLDEQKIIQITEELGINDRLKHKPSQLSSGEKQRVALARAMILQPTILLADEPTGNLDDKNSFEVLECLKKYQEKGGTVVMVTHGSQADKYATKTVQLERGKLLK